MRSRGCVHIGEYDGDITTMASDGFVVVSGMARSHGGCTGHGALLLFWILGLIEEEVGCQLLVLVAREVGLDD